VLLVSGFAMLKASAHQKRLPVLIGDMNQADRNGILGSLTGFPAIVVPAGFSSPTKDVPIGVPVGIEFLGQPVSEPQLLKMPIASSRRLMPVNHHSQRRHCQEDRQHPGRAR
jgi:Asp-tRNA(Asn)/Glu-tRNA(Gln) amidotransferase A subunit family amidase